MSQVTMKQLLEAGVHFGHQTSRWNPKMRPYLFGARNGIHIIDLQQTVSMFREACDFLRDVSARGGYVLFVGTKKQAHEAIRTESERSGQFYVNNRWLGGTLTNFQTIKQSIERMRRVEETLADPTSQTTYKKKERLMMQRELDKLLFNLDGFRDMKKPPDALFVIDPDREAIAVAEANRLEIPVVAVVDSNCNPDRIAYCIPGNDDAIRAIRLFCGAAADAVLEGAMVREERRRIQEKVGDPGAPGSVEQATQATLEAAPAAPTAGAAPAAAPEAPVASEAAAEAPASEAAPVAAPEAAPATAPEAADSVAAPSDTEATAEPNAETKTSTTE